MDRSTCIYDEDDDGDDDEDDDGYLLSIDLNINAFAARPNHSQLSKS